MEQKVTLGTLQQKKRERIPITCLTAYDYPTAKLLDECGVDMLLIGDSVGMTVHGFDSTLPVTMDMMILHCQAVRRGSSRAFLIGDMPFMSYQADLSDAMHNAARMLSEGGVDAVKLEGGMRMVETVRALVETGIAVQGHIGLTPQSVSAFGGFKTQGKTIEQAAQLIESALALEEAGVFSIVLEAIPAKLATLISRKLTIPTIGIGAGSGCDGQVLVLHDLLGLYDRLHPKFVKKYANLSDSIREAVTAYNEDVVTRTFPAEEHSFAISDEVWDDITSRFGE